MFPMQMDNQDFIKDHIVEERKIVKNNLISNLIFSKSGFIAQIIKIPPKQDKILPYTALPRNQDDERKINEIITTLGKHGKIDLLLHHEKKLNKMGDEIRHLHPFKFLGYIFSHKDPDGVELKKHMVTIFDDYFKRTGFVADFSQGMNLFGLKNQLNIYLKDFAEEASIDVNKITHFFNKNSKDYGNWEEFIRTIINN